MMEIFRHVISLHRFTLVAQLWYDAAEAPFVLQSEAVLTISIFSVETLTVKIHEGKGPTRYIVTSIYDFSRIGMYLRVQVCEGICFVVIRRYERKILMISTIFRKNTRNSLIPQCKTSIGNNSGSIKCIVIGKIVKFAYSRVFQKLRIEMV